ncbi:hypothetical protein D3C81_1750230 [compost metagenome]
MPETISMCPALLNSSRWESTAAACRVSRAMSIPTTPMTLPSTSSGREMVVINTSLSATVSAYGSSRQVRLLSRGQVYHTL